MDEVEEREETEPLSWIFEDACRHVLAWFAVQVMAVWFLHAVCVADQLVE